jgi:hypothetical protein
MVDNVLYQIQTIYYLKLENSMNEKNILLGDPKIPDGAHHEILLIKVGT